MCCGCVHIDINECSDKRLCSNANQRCANVPGTYRCLCIDGYQNVHGLCEGKYTTDLC